MRRVAGETEAAVDASADEETSAACSSARSASWVFAKRGIGIGSCGGGIAVLWLSLLAASHSSVGSAVSPDEAQVLCRG